MATLLTYPGCSRTRRSSPLRTLRALFARLTNTGANRLAIEIGTHQLDRQEAAIHTGIRGARRIENRLGTHRGQVAAYLTDAKTPGIIDPEEARDLTRALIQTEATTTTHRQHLEDQA